MGFSSCEVINPAEEVPAYLYVDNIRLKPGAEQGVATDSFPDIWVSSNGSFRGVYPLPAQIPLQTRKGLTDVRITPGIFDRGGTNRRLPYGITAGLDTSLALLPGTTDTLSPQVGYRSDVAFAFLETFENPRSPAFRRSAGESDTIPFSVSPEDSIDGRNLRAVIPPDGFLKLALFRFDEAVMAGSTVFLEADLRNTLVVFFASEVEARNNEGMQLAKQEVSEAGFFASSQWRKVYLNLSPDIENFRQQGFTGWRLLLLMVNESDEDKVFQLDNLKVIYRP